MINVLNNGIRSAVFSIIRKKYSRSRLSSTYKAAVLKDENKFIIENLDLKKLDKNDVRIQVQFSTINYADCKSFTKRTSQTAIVPGYEVAGKVLEIGKDVKSDIKVGDRVVGLNMNTFGGLAQQCTVNINDIWQLPSEMELKDVVSLLYDYSTAVLGFSFMCSYMQLENKVVLLSYNFETVGLAALDIAANVYKAKVIAVCSDEEVTSFMRDKGAFAALKFEKSNFKKSVLKSINRKEIEIVFDAAGGEVFDSLVKCLEPQRSILCPVSLYSSNSCSVPPNFNFSILSLNALKTQSLELYREIIMDTLEMAGQGLITPHVTNKFKLEKINEAVKYVKEKSPHGKVLITIDD